ncbi:hypothetical protein B0T17DRAFT_523434 [Bombardia bombarda]|uniref:Uncharacterized protein n=1 Tax=Bombardia bombarda TaxID=252184 RepID=A0AA39X7D2_9PEZI|nr:hypothetical protein B0T17DRAFT_523434 [Bombardia bombarda]
MGVSQIHPLGRAPKTMLTSNNESSNYMLLTSNFARALASGANEATRSTITLTFFTLSHLCTQSDDYLNDDGRDELGELRR